MTIMPALRVLSFDTPLAISGITNWNLRMARAFREQPELGIDWHAVEVGDMAQFTAAAGSDPGENRSTTFVGLSSDESVFANFRKAYGVYPDWRMADVVVPNGVMHGWLLPAELQREYGRRPAVLGGIHSDIDIDYDINGRGASTLEGVFAVSTYCAAEFERRYGRSAAFVSYGVPVETDELAKPGAGPITLVYCGRVVTRQKRVLELARLADRLAEAGVDFVLHIVGDGPELPALRDATSRHGQRVVTHGSLPPQAVVPFLRDKHVIVSVSDYEGTSISMLEAMGQGLVPVVTRIDSGVGDAIIEGQSGLTVEIGDIEAMAQHIAGLAADRTRLARMADAARELVAQNYSLAVSTKRMALLLHKVALAPRGEYQVARDHPILGRRLDRTWLPGWAVKAARRIVAVAR